MIIKFFLFTLISVLHFKSIAQQSNPIVEPSKITAEPNKSATEPSKTTAEQNKAVVEEHNGIELAITFDDLPAVVYTDGPKVSEEKINEIQKEIIETSVKNLEKHKIEHVFGFVNGITTKHMSKRYELLNMWKSAGHMFGNHTFSHFDYGNVKTEKYITDIEDNESLLLDYAHSIEELKHFRFPFLQEGDTKAKRYNLRAYLSKRNYIIAPVTVDFEDWVLGEAYFRCVMTKKMSEVKKLEDKYLKLAKERLIHADKLARFIYGQPKKQILLLHVNLITAEMLDRLLQMYKELGVKFISLNDALKESIYHEDPAIWEKAGSSFLLQVQKSRKLVDASLAIPPIKRAEIEDFCR